MDGRSARWKRSLNWRVALAGAIAAFALGAPAGAGATVQPRPDLTTCFWTLAAGATPATNKLMTDPNEIAFGAWVVLPRGGTLRLRHEFPHARSVAWSTYNPFTFAAIDVMRDREIVPDAGAGNPFVAGADRRAPHRAYTMTISTGRAPAEGRQPNTLYTNGQTLFAVFYRIYVPDQGRDRLGDTGLPDPAYRPFRWGPTLTGGRACLALNGGRAMTEPLNQIVWNSTTVGLTLPYLALRGMKPEAPAFPAVAEGAWDVFFNFTRLSAPFLRGTPREREIDRMPVHREGPAGDWASDSAVAFDYVDRRLGPHPDGRNVLVLRGTLPRTPTTAQGDATMQGDVDLRYWSLCMQTAIPLGVTGACLYDEQIPLDARRRYTIIVSTPEDRPANATAACGVAWLDWGTVGDGYGRRTAGMLALRNQDPSPEFGHAMQDVAAPGQERAVMGEYLPTQTYQTPEAFATTGCPPVTGELPTGQP